MKSFFKPTNILIFLIALAGAITCNFFWRSAKDIIINMTLDHQVVANEIQWQIDKDINKKYIITAIYNFDDSNKNRHNGKTIFDNKKFINYYAALDGISKLSKRDLIVWYSGKNSQISELEHNFQIKNLIYLGVSVAVLIYFIIINIRMRKYEN